MTAWTTVWMFQAWAGKGVLSMLDKVGAANQGQSVDRAARRQLEC